MLKVKEVVRALSSKGQVTVPAEVRRLLGVGPSDKVVFRIADGRVELWAAPMTLEDTFGAVKPLQQPEDFRGLRETARRERVQHIVEEMQE